MNDSCANVFCRRAGERSGPVKNGDFDDVRQHALAADGAGPTAHGADACRSMYDGTVLLPLSYLHRRGAGERG